MVLRPQGPMQKDWLRRDIVGSVYLLIEAFLHANTLQLLQHCLLCVKMKGSCRWSFSTRMFFFFFGVGICMYLQFFYRDSPSLRFAEKYFFHMLARFVPSHMIFPNPLVKLAWLPKLLGHIKPQTHDINSLAMPPPGLSLACGD